MIDGWLALIVAAAALGGYLVGVWQVLNDTREEQKLRERQKFDTIRAVNYTKRGS